MAVPLAEERRPLAAIARPTRMRVDPKNYAHLPYIGLEHIESQTGRLLGTAHATSMRSAAIHFLPDDVLYGRLRPYLNKVHHARFEGLCSSEFIVLVPGEMVAPRYLRHALASPAFVADAAQVSTGDRPRVDWTQISSFRIPLPAVDQQLAVSAALDEQATRLVLGREMLRRAEIKLGRYVRTVLELAAVGQLSETGGGSPARPAWPVTELGQLVQEMRNGIPQRPDDPAEGGTPILRISAVRAFAVDLSQARRISLEAPAAFFLRDDDLLFTRYSGNPNLVGGCGRVHGIREPILYPDKLIRVRVDTEKVLPAYVELAVNTGATRAFIRSLVKTTAGQAGVSGRDLKRAPIPVPPLDEQMRLLEVVKRQREAAAVLQVTLRQAGRRAAVLEAANLAAEFPSS